MSHKKWIQLGIPGIGEDEILENFQDLNPLINIHGPGPRGSLCKTCAQLSWHTAWLKKKCKCSLNSQADHHAYWNACGKYEPKD